MYCIRVSMETTMIKNLAGGRYITVTGATVSDPYISPGAVGSGMMRWNPNMNCMEVNDGNTWKQFTSSYPTIDLNHEAQELMDWARKEKNKQLERERRIRENPALLKAYEAIQRAEANFDILDRIVGDDLQAEQVQSSP